MANVTPLKREELAQLQQVLNASEAMMGFIPNSMLTMSHMPQLTMAFSLLAGTVFGADLKATMAAYQDIVPEDPNADEALSPDLVQLIAFSVSVAAGCRYCQAHTGHNAHKFGVPEEKLAAILSFESSDQFSDAERAVVGLALAAGQVPNGSDASHFEALKAHYTDRQVVQIVGVISLFGFLNRWNDTMATELESLPKGFAQDTLSASGWQVDKHAG